MQQVHHRITPVALGLITGRQIDRNIAIRRLSRQIPFERFAVNLDAGVCALTADCAITAREMPRERLRIEVAALIISSTFTAESELL